MAIEWVQGDVTRTQAQALMIGLNTKGRVDVNPLEIDLRDRYPVFFAEHRRRAKGEVLHAGQVWFFRESNPWLLGATVRGVPSGAIRLRHLENILINLRRDWQREGLKSLAIAPLAPEPEWKIVQEVLESHLRYLPIPVFIYQSYSISPLK